MAEIFSIAIFEPVEGHEADALVTLRELRTALTAKGYSRDSVHRQASPPQHYVLLRHWRSVDPNVVGFLHRPASAVKDALVLTHGAGSNCRTQLLVELAEAFARAGMLVL